MSNVNKLSKSVLLAQHMSNLALMKLFGCSEVMWERQDILTKTYDGAGEYGQGVRYIEFLGIAYGISTKHHYHVIVSVKIEKEPISGVWISRRVSVLRSRPKVYRMVDPDIKSPCTIYLCDDTDEGLPSRATL